MPCGCPAPAALFPAPPTPLGNPTQQLFLLLLFLQGLRTCPVLLSRCGRRGQRAADASRQGRQRREGPCRAEGVHLPPQARCVWLGAPTPDWRLKTAQQRQNKPFCNYTPPEESACPHRPRGQGHSPQGQPTLHGPNPTSHLSNCRGRPLRPDGNSSLSLR